MYYLYFGIFWFVMNKWNHLGRGYTTSLVDSCDEFICIIHGYYPRTSVCVRRCQWGKLEWFVYNLLVHNHIEAHQSAHNVHNISGVCFFLRFLVFANWHIHTTLRYQYVELSHQFLSVTTPGVGGTEYGDCSHPCPNYAARIKRRCLHLRNSWIFAVTTVCSWL